MPAGEKERRMETVPLIGQFNKQPKRNRAEACSPRLARGRTFTGRHGRRLGKACALAVLRYGTYMARAPRYRLAGPGDGQLKSL